MPSRSNDEDRDTQAGVKSYGAPTGPAASMSGAKRNVAGPGSDSARRAAIAADVAASRQPVKTAPAAAPASRPAPTVFGAAAAVGRRKRQIDQEVDKASK